MIAAARIDSPGPIRRSSVETALSRVASELPGDWRLSGGVLRCDEDRRRGQYWIEAFPLEGPSGRDVAQILTRLLGSSEWEPTVFVGRLLGEVTAQDFDEGATRYVLHVPYSAPHAELAALDAWYVGEHDAMVMRCAEWTAIRRYEPVEGSTADWSRLVVHELLGAEVLNSPYVRESMATPQRRRFAEHDWFGAGGRHVLPIVVPSQAKQGSRASTTSR